MEAKLAREPIERDQAADRGQTPIGLTHAEPRDVGATHPPPLPLKLPPLRRLASCAPPSHLPGARRVDCFCHRKQNNRRAEPQIPAPREISLACVRSDGAKSTLSVDFAPMRAEGAERLRRRACRWPMELVG